MPRNPGNSPEVRGERTETKDLRSMDMGVIALIDIDMYPARTKILGFFTVGRYVSKADSGGYHELTVIQPDGSPMWARVYVADGKVCKVTPGATDQAESLFPPEAVFYTSNRTATDHGQEADK